MTLYHGSFVPHLTKLMPFPSNHGKPYVYLSDNATLALLYAHNPIARPGGFFPYWFDKAGKLHYDEYFPDQMHQMYGGHDGWVYHASANGLTQLDNMPWVYLSESPVQVIRAVHIPDLYAALLDAEQAGQLILHRYKDIPEEQREIHRKIVRKSLEDQPVADYVRFLRAYMPELF